MYISFIGKTENPNQQIPAERLPVIGPVQLSWTYGHFKIHDLDWDTLEWLSMSKKKSDLILIKDNYYGAFEVWNNNHTSIELSRKQNRSFINWKEFLESNLQTRKHLDHFLIEGKQIEQEPAEQPSETNIMYINFFHGREDPEMDMDDWGDHGPILGPVQLSWDYTEGIKIHKPDDKNVFQYLPLSKEGDLVHIDKTFYGDFEILPYNDPLIEKNRQDSRAFLTWEEFFAINEKQHIL